MKKFLPSLVLLGLIVACPPKGDDDSTVQDDDATTTPTATATATPSATPTQDPWGGRSIDDAYDTSQILLVDTVHQQGYTGEYYENHAYTCGKQGYQTFLIVYPDNLPSTTVRPLWVRMHGGGVGAFNDAGDYVPGEMLGSNNQESITKLANIMGESGLVAKVRTHASGFRFLLPSLCDHDVYSGIGIPDSRNPYSPDENGNTRAADGLLATKAAIVYTRAHYSSSHTFLHGTSAGSIGSFGVALSLEREGLRLSGIVSDSHVVGPGILDNAFLGCMPFPYDPLYLVPKIGPLLTDAWYPQDIVAQGGITVPIYHIWNQNDGACCGSAINTYTDAQGNSYQEEGCRHEHDPYGQAILASPNGQAGISITHEVCVDDPSHPQGHCNKHSPTKDSFDRPVIPGDQLNGNSDYNQHILDWVDQRLLDPAP